MFSISPFLWQCFLMNAPLPSANGVRFQWTQFLNLKIRGICKQSHVALSPSLLVNAPIPRLQVFLEEQICVVHWKILMPLESYSFLPSNVNVPWDPLRDSSYVRHGFVRDLTCRNQGRGLSVEASRFISFHSQSDQVLANWSIEEKQIHTHWYPLPVPLGPGLIQPHHFCHQMKYSPSCFSHLS